MNVRRFSAHVFALTTALVCLLAAVAVASALKGASYKAKVTHSGGWNYAVTLRVASTGKVASFSVQKPPIPCGVGVPLKAQVTKPAPISSSGAYKNSIVYKYDPQPSIAIKVSIVGKFSGHTFKGTFKNETGGECDWSMPISARS